jgi:translocation and assembly module TamB
MRRAARLWAWALAAMVVLPLLLATLVVVIANTDPGRRALERALAQASGGQVVLEGLAGRFPDRLRVARIQMRDRDGTWGVAVDLALDWSPSRLLRGEAHVAYLELARLALHRLPVAEDPPSRREASTGLPVRVDVDALHITTLDLAPPIAGVASTLEVRGRAHLVSTSQFDLALKVDRLDAPGTYHLQGGADASRLAVHLDLSEPAGGLLARLAGLPDLGAMSVKASIDGPRNAEQVRLAVAAGPAHGTAQGTIDLEGRVLDLQVAAEAPAMRPSADVAWQSATLQGYVKGPYATPDANVLLRIRGVQAGEGEFRDLEAELAGNAEAMALHAILEGLRIPGARPDLFAAAPVRLQANARLHDPARPVDFALSHPLLAVEGHASTGGEPSGTANLTIPRLAPFAAAAGMDLEGRTTIAMRVATKDDVTRVDVDGSVGLTGGTGPLPALIASDAKVVLSAALRGDALTVERAQLNGRAVHLSATGARRGEAFDFSWKAVLSDLAALAPALRGALSAEGRARGTPRELAVEADVRGDVGTREFAPETIEAHLTAKGPPNAPSGVIRARGRLLGAPLHLAAQLQHDRDGTLRVAIDRADWKSARAEGQVTVPVGDRVPRGRIAVRMTRLDDLQALVGQSLQGSVVANVEFVPQGATGDALVHVEARGVGLADAAAERVTLSGRIGALSTRPTAALQLVADGIAAQGVTGSARIDLNGPQDRLRVKVSSRLQHRDGYEANLSAAAHINATAHTARVNVLTLQYRGQSARLLQPALFKFADGIAVDRLRVGVQQAVLEVAGRLTPALDLRASLRGVTPALLKPYMPHLDAVGTLGMDAKLTGAAALPRGKIRVDLAGLRMRSGPARALPAANLLATADLDGRAAQIRARLDAGPRVRLALNGTAPLGAAERMDLRATGTLDLALANPLIEADGRRAQGRVALDVGVTGLYAAPRLNGTVTITEADLQDIARGARLSDIASLLRLEGDTLWITRFTGRAGRGTVTASGEVGVLQPGMPVDITIAARNARPLAADLITADLDMDLRLRGAARTRIDAVGQVQVKHADINIPGGLPSSVAVLDVRRPGEKPAPVSTRPALVVGLDVGVDAPRAVFVRGRGLDAEMGGKLHVGGTVEAPEISGGFELRRGTFDLAGASLKFTRGQVGFSGTGLQRKLDPTLDFAAETAAGGVTARVGVTGFASAPKIALGSTPELPQDEVLARLLFGVSVKELSPLQIVQIARAVASLRGSGGGGPNPLANVQKRLGLDRFSVSGGDGKSGPSVEAGRYVSERVYVGARQSTSGATQTRVQVDLTRRLKLETSLGSGGGTLQRATPENDPGTSVGLVYQVEY